MEAAGADSGAGMRVIKTLVEAGANIEAKDKVTGANANRLPCVLIGNARVRTWQDGHTAFHRIVAAGKDVLAIEFVNLGASPKTTNDVCNVRT